MEAILDDNAPSELKELFYDKTLSLRDIESAPEWIPWLEGREEYIRNYCIKDVDYYYWTSRGEYNQEIIGEYMCRLFEDTLRYEIINRRIGSTKHVLTEEFKRRNSDIFFDDLPDKLRIMFQKEECNFSDIFDLSDEDKELLKGKKLSMAFDRYEYQSFFERLGDSIEDFELYKQYRSIIYSIKEAIDNRSFTKEIDLNDKKSFLEQTSLIIINELYWEYGEEMPDDFKQKYPELFLSEDAPQELKEVFYRKRASRYKIGGPGFEYFRENPELLLFLKGKSKLHIFNGSAKDFFAFCGSEDLAMELGIKYGNDVFKIFDYSLLPDEVTLPKEEQLWRVMYRSAQEDTFKYDGNMPEEFKAQYPELFLSEVEVAKITELDLKEEEINSEKKLKQEELVYRFYDKNIHFSDLIQYPYFKDILKNKNLKIVMHPMYDYLMELCNNDKDKFIEIGCEYEDILRFGDVIKRHLPEGVDFSQLNIEEIKEILDEVIYKGIVHFDFYEYNDGISIRFQEKYPELFILPDELKQLKESYPDKIEYLKTNFYDGAISFQEMKEYPLLKEILCNKDYGIYMRTLAGSEFLDKFIRVLGNRKRAFNLACGKFAKTLDEVLYDENVDDVIEYYNQAGFIPKPAIISKLPREYIKGFALNKKLWGKLMSISEYNISDDYIGSLLEAAVVMGVFETKEFVRNGQTMLQGAGGKGFNKLMKLLESENTKSNKSRYINAHVLHQIFDGMKLIYNEEFSDFMLENIGEILRENNLIEIINPIQSRVIGMSQDPDYAETKITLEIVLRAMDENEYLGKKIGFEKGLELAQKFAFEQEYFEEAQRIWEEARKREASSIPRIEGRDEEYSYEVLRLDDVAGIFIGNITDCCQKIGGAGETSMLHSMLEENGRVFVVRDADKKIISQSWLWRNGNLICFDNVEVPRSANNQKNQDAIYKILKKVAKELCEKDNEVINNLIEEGKITKEVAEKMKLKKVTVGIGNTDIDKIRCEKADSEAKYPIEKDKYYEGVGKRKWPLYVADSARQVVLYEAEGYKSGEDIPTLAIYFDENIEKSATEITELELKLMQSIQKEEKGYFTINTINEFADEYGVAIEDLKVIFGTDWFMLYSEQDSGITVYKMHKSPSSGIVKKSIKEQREAAEMLMKKGKTISMETENDNVYKAAKSIIRDMQKQYEMKVEEEENRIRVSEIEER